VLMVAPTLRQGAKDYRNGSGVGTITKAFFPCMGAESRFGYAGMQVGRGADR
jgi:hypothetical protein